MLNGVLIVLMCWVENGCMMYVNFFGWDIDCLFI